MKKLLYTVLYMTVIPCYAHQAQNTVDLGNLDFNNWLQNCTVNINTSDNSVEDIINTEATPAKFRECLQQNLSKTHNKICTSIDELERQRQDVNSDADRAHIENSIARLDEIHFNFNNTLYEQVNKWDTRVNNFAGRYSGTTSERFYQNLMQQEIEAIRDILNTQSYSECNNLLQL